MSKDQLNIFSVGLAGIRTQGNLFQFEQKPQVIVYYNLDYVKDPKGSNYWRNRVLKVAGDYKRKVHFAVSNKEEFSAEVEQNGLGERKDSDKPIVAAITNDGKFPMNQEFSVENLKAFVDDVLAGNADPYMKSEPVPETQGDVKVAVGKNFKELILDADKDALIEFYAPWCGHCKSLAPKYDELGAKVRNFRLMLWGQQQRQFDTVTRDYHNNSVIHIAIHILINLAVWIVLLNLDLLDLISDSKQLYIYFKNGSAETVKISGFTSFNNGAKL